MMNSITYLNKKTRRIAFLIIAFWAIGFGTILRAQTNVNLPANNCQNCETLAVLTTGAPGTVTTVIPACGNVTVNGTYTAGTALTASNTVDIDIDAQNTGPYTISTNTVNGYSFSATGNFTTTGVQTITLVGTGTPSLGGTDVFQSTYTSSSCSFQISVGGTGVFPATTINDCGKPTVVQNVTSATGRVWMDRNLGATRVANTQYDDAAYGHLYQWGRSSDGHQCYFSHDIVTGLVNVLFTTVTPNDDRFVLRSIHPIDWIGPQNPNLWQGVDGTNNPCPRHYRIPTAAEWIEERNSWSSPDTTGAFNSALRLPAAGHRQTGGGIVDGTAYEYMSDRGLYWSSDIGTPLGASQTSLFMYIRPASADMSSNGYRGGGRTVRCIRCSQSAGAAAGDNASNCPFP